MALRVLTFNIWGLPDMITKTVYRELYKDLNSYQNKEQRMANICKVIEDYDVIMFQEAWSEPDRVLLRNHGKEHGLEFSHYFRSHAQGSGLLMLSRYPIEDVHFQPYSLNGTPLNVHHGDWYVGKGCAMAIVRVPTAACRATAAADSKDTERHVTIYSTHTIAEYELPPRDIYKGHRCAQLWEALKFIRVSYRRNSDPRGLTLFVGDFNCLPGSAEHRMLTEFGQLTDCFEEFRLLCRERPADYAHVDDGDDSGHTIIDVTVDGKAKRLDYVMMLGCESAPWKIERVHVTARSGASSDGRIYSDHSAVAANFVADDGVRGDSADAAQVDSSEFIEQDHYRLTNEAHAARDVLREMMHEVQRSEEMLAARERFHLVSAIASITFVTAIFVLKALGIHVPGLPLLFIDFIEGIVLLYGFLVLILYVYWRIESQALRKVADECSFYSEPGPHRDRLR